MYMASKKENLDSSLWKGVAQQRGSADILGLAQRILIEASRKSLVKPGWALLGDLVVRRTIVRSLSLGIQ